MSEKGKVVCVTGASGYIASWLVKLLLIRGYTVHAALRYPHDISKTRHLRELEGAKERLQLFKADLLEEGSFDAAISGCHAVFHTASPVISNIIDPQKWYALSKTLAEESAWKFAKENSIDMVSINPGMVVGPMLQPTLNESVAIISKFFNGAETYANVTFCWVDVKDVAIAHILALEVSSAQGRYCLVDSVAHMSHIVEMLRQLYPSTAFPDRCADDNPSEQTYQFSQTKAKSLGIEYTPLQASLKQTVESLIEKGFINPV